MPKCPECRKDLSRMPRSRLQKIVYSTFYRCTHCKLRMGWYHPFLYRQLVQVRFVFSRQSRCIRCSSYAVHKIDRRDHVDSMSKHLLSGFQRLFGAPIVKCPDCRLQYHDWRPIRRPRENRDSSKNLKTDKI
jgi:uncharacterized protein with PIN domain